MGANDFASGKPLGDPDRFAQGTFRWDYDTVLRGFIENLPDVPLLLATAQYRADADTPNAQGKTLDEYNAVVRDLADRYHLRLADAFTNAGIDARNFPALSADEGHLNDEGYQRLAAFFIECLQTDRCD